MINEKIKFDSSNTHPSDAHECVCHFEFDKIDNVICALASGIVQRTYNDKGKNRRKAVGGFFLTRLAGVFALRCVCSFLHAKSSGNENKRHTRTGKFRFKIESIPYTLGYPVHCNRCCRILAASNLWSRNNKGKNISEVYKVMDEKAENVLVMPSYICFLIRVFRISNSYTKAI